jgi:hypothetical protein
MHGRRACALFRGPPRASHGVASGGPCGCVFARIRDDRDLFEQRVKPDSRTIECPGDVDLDPDVLYRTHGPVAGIRITRRVVQAPAHA